MCTIVWKWKQYIWNIPNNIFGIHSDFSSLKIRILKILERQVLEDFFRSVNQAVPILEVTHDKRCQV